MSSSSFSCRRRSWSRAARRLSRSLRNCSKQRLSTASCCSISNSCPTQAHNQLLPTQITSPIAWLDRHSLCWNYSYGKKHNKSLFVIQPTFALSKLNSLCWIYCCAKKHRNFLFTIAYHRGRFRL